MSLELVASLPEDPTEAWKLITDSFLTLVSEYRFQTSGLPLQGERVFRKENNYHEDCGALSVDLQERWHTLETGQNNAMNFHTPENNSTGLDQMLYS